MQARWQVACTLGACALGLSAGCERLLSIQDPIAGDGPPRDTGGDDGGITDAAPAASSPILLSEVVLTRDEGEMIEIYNASDQEVDLSTYYLSDNGNYFRLPVKPTQTAVDATDFIVKFPTGARIPARGVMTVALNTPANFSSVYAMSPNFSFTDGTMQIISMNGMPNLTNGGEPVILFQWDGQSDLVRDVDMVLIGTPTAANGLPSKSSVQQDGPDPDTQPSQYAVDTNALMPQAATPGNGQSAKRILLEDTHETHGGSGNGQSGDDETSEDTRTTWEVSATPTPGQVPQALKP